jgi:hypothetical protein
LFTGVTGVHASLAFENSLISGLLNVAENFFKPTISSCSGGRRRDVSGVFGAGDYRLHVVCALIISDC